VHTTSESCFGDMTMTKIRISADQISNFKALAKAFSAIIQEKFYG
jgi:hypothetical protein